MIYPFKLCLKVLVLLGFFEYIWSFIADQGIDERESAFFPVLVFEGTDHFCIIVACF